MILVILLSAAVAVGTEAVPKVAPPALERAEQHVKDLAKILGDLKASVQPRDCGDLYEAGQTTSGVYTVFPTNGSLGLAVHCDMETDGGGWTVIQKRGQFGNPVYYFYRNWTEYANGFGDPTKEYWIGNNVLHELTNRERTFELRIELNNATGKTFVAKYTAFKVGSATSFYKLTLGDYSGPPDSESFKSADGASFSTFDSDHDKDPNNNCAERFRGGWWYAACHVSNLNGLNLNGPHDSFADGIEWSHINNYSGLYHYSYRQVEMKIRPSGFGVAVTSLLDARQAPKLE